MTAEKESFGPHNWMLGTTYSLANPVDLHKIKRAGIQCLELTWHTLDIFDPEVKSTFDETVKHAKELGLNIGSIHIPYGTNWDPSNPNEHIREAVVKKVCKILTYAKEWNVKIVVFHPSWEPISPEERADRLNICKETLGIIAEEASSLGVHLAVECLPRTCLGNCGDEIEYLVADHPNLGICCDVNHLFKELPEQFIKRLGAKIITTHISDNDGNDEKHWLPGEGVIHWDSVVNALAGVNYNGVFLYETSNRDPERIKENWKWLKGIK